MKNLIYLILGFVGLLTGCAIDGFPECTGNGCLIFEGKITDTSGNSLEDTDLTLVFDEASFANWFFSDREVLKRTRTDENGNYRMAIFGEDYRDGEGFFEIIANKENFIKRDKSIHDIDSSDFDTPILVDIDLAPEATLELLLQTVSGVSDLEYNLVVDYSPTIFDLSQSANLDTTYTYRVAGDQYVSVYYKYKKSGAEINRSDSVFIERGATGQINIIID